MKNNLKYESIQWYPPGQSGHNPTILNGNQVYRLSEDIYLLRSSGGPIELNPADWIVTIGNVLMRLSDQEFKVFRETGEII